MTARDDFLSRFLEAPGPRVFSIPAGRPFLHDLAAQLHGFSGDDPASLSDTLILLPTRRAVRALTDALVETSPTKSAALLPRMKALGDVDEDEFAAFDGPAANEIDLPPAISLMERRLILAKLIAAFKRRFDGQDRWAGALSAADELGKLLDSFYTEEIDTTKLKTIVPASHAEHWGQSLEFLSIVTKAWPQHLDEHNLMDPAARRSALIDAQARLWETSPPQTPVIIAGTTGSTPAVARMMRVVAALPQGCVILPGLDLESGPRVWEAVDEPHPQSGLKHLLKRLDVERESVRPFPAPEGRPPDAGARSQLLALALRPAHASDDWCKWAQSACAHDASLRRALQGFSMVEAADEEMEASAVALKLRETIETPDKTAMLVTPDRNLARRTAMKMRRWGVIVDDSAGVPFANSPCGTYLRLVALWLSEISNPIALLALIRHPLFFAGLDESALRKSANAMDRALRGLRPRPGLDGLARKIRGNDKLAAQAAPLLEAIRHIAGDWPASTASFAERLSAHIVIAEAFATTDVQGGDNLLWRGEDGEAGAALLADIAASAAQITHDRDGDYPAIFDQLIAGAVVRRTAPAHPRIAILGPLEARLQTADTVILGGLNEGVWPRDAAIDPFLSRPMRKEIGLPSPERRIGLSAHDFAQLAASGEVMATRAMRTGGAPAKPSRWIVRLKNILTSVERLGDVDATNHFAQLANRLDAPCAVNTAPAPMPRPPAAARPTTFFVTRIEKLLRDPYAIYARDILKLNKLDALNEGFSARHAGNLFHKVFQEYAEGEPLATHEARMRVLHELFDKHADAFGLTNEHRAFWASPIRESVEWFAEWDAQKRREGKPLAEATGQWTFDIDGREHSLSARADRIDRRHDGGAFIIDYKTGALPTRKQLATFSPQLPLTALIAREGGFDALGSTPIEGFEYIRVLRRTNAKKDHIGEHGKDAAQLIDERREGLMALMAHFNDPASGYPSQPRPELVDEYGKYDHLARRREREAAGGEE